MKLFLIIVAILVVAFFVVATPVAFRPAKPSLPPRHVVQTEQEARRLAGQSAVIVLGTGSMHPYIPATVNPNQIVAIAAVERAPYDYLKKGDLVVYKWENTFIIHQIMGRQGKSWISSGINNPHYDGPRVTPETYHSRVVRIYIIAETTNEVAVGSR
jgi:hypothetical protein